MSTISQDLLSQLSGPPLQDIAGKLGLSPAQTQSAIGTALPLLLGTLGKNASQPQGAEALMSALGRDHAQSGGIADVLGAVLGSGGAGRNADGAGILGHVFGGQQAQAEARLGQASGIGGEKAAMLMKILAPIVMAYLAKRVLGGGNGSNAEAGANLGQMLSGEAGAGGLLTSMLDQDGDGQLGLSDVLKAGSNFFGR